MDEKNNILDETIEEVVENIETYNEEIITDEITPAESEDIVQENDALLESEESFEESDSSSVEEFSLEENKKKVPLLDKSIKKSFIIVGVVALILVIGFALRATGILYEKSVVGSWSVVVEDGVEQIYTFENDGDFKLTVGPTSYLGNWSESESLTDDASAKAITYTITYAGQSISFNYEVTGAPFKPRTLTFSDGSYEVSLTEVHSYKNEIKVDRELVVEEKAIGEWYNEESDITFVFTKDCQITQSMYGAEANGLCNVADGKIEIILSEDENEEPIVYDYKFKDEKLIIADIEFSKVD